MSIYYIISYKKIKKQGINYTLFSYFGADEGTRTPTPLALVPKTSASTNSATSAFRIDNTYNSTFYISLSIEK